MQLITLPKASSFHPFVRTTPLYEEYVRTLVHAPITNTAFDLEFSSIAVPVDSTIHKLYLRLLDTYPEYFI